MPTAVVFDFDGVIVNTEPLHYRAFQEVLVPLGLGYPWEEYVSLYIGFDDRDAFRASFKAAGMSLDEERLCTLIRGKAAAFNRIISSGVDAYPGVVELIRSLRASVPIGLCSGALRADIEPILLQLGLTGAFDVMVTADDVDVSKPDPASYRLAVQSLAAAFPNNRIVAEKCIAIEDTPAGIASAMGAGLQVLAVTNSYEASVLAAAGRVVDSLAGIDYVGLGTLLRDSSP